MKQHFRISKAIIKYAFKKTRIGLIREIILQLHKRLTHNFAELSVCVHSMFCLGDCVVYLADKFSSANGVPSGSNLNGYGE